MVLGAGLTLTFIGLAIAEQQQRAFTANGTVLETRDPGDLRTAQDGPTDRQVRHVEFLTSDVTGRAEVIRLDLAWLKTSGYGGFVDLENGETIQVELVEQPDGSFLAIRYWGLVRGSAVNKTDRGVSELFTTRDDSINARVDDGPDDDAARRQGGRFDDKGCRSNHH